MLTDFILTQRATQSPYAAQLNRTRNAAISQWNRRMIDRIHRVCLHYLGYAPPTLTQLLTSLMSCDTSSALSIRWQVAGAVSYASEPTAPSRTNLRAMSGQMMSTPHTGSLAAGYSALGYRRCQPMSTSASQTTTPYSQPMHPERRRPIATYSTNGSCQ